MQVEPSYDSWGVMVDLAGRGGEAEVEERRREVRRELLSLAADTTRAYGSDVTFDPDEAVDAPIVATGHQPLLYHPGVWFKAFAAHDCARKLGGVAVDVVVDTDVARRVSFDLVVGEPEPTRVSVTLATAPEGAWIAHLPAPDGATLAEFARELLEHVDVLALPATQRSVKEFLSILATESMRSATLAETLVRTRRKFESPAALEVLELPVTAIMHGPSWRRFVLEVVSDPARFASAFNGSLTRFRQRHRTRSSAQPFPDMESAPGRVELPFWYLDERGRRPLYLQGDGPDAVLATPEGVVCAVRDVAGRSHELAPKAVALTAFLRAWFADVFIHGTGGYRYDEVCDDVVRAFWGVEPAPRTCVTGTLASPIPFDVVTLEDVASLRALVNRIAHHPREFLEEADLDERASLEVEDLLAEKDGLVASLGSVDADRKALSMRIKEVDRTVALYLEPLRERLEAELDDLDRVRASQEVLSDRTLSYALYDPAEVAVFVSRSLSAPPRTAR